MSWFWQQLSAQHCLRVEEPTEVVEIAAILAAHLNRLVVIEVGPIRVEVVRVVPSNLDQRTAVEVTEEHREVLPLVIRDVETTDHAVSRPGASRLEATKTAETRVEEMTVAEPVIRVEQMIRVEVVIKVEEMIEVEPEIPVGPPNLEDQEDPQLVTKDEAMNELVMSKTVETRIGATRTGATRTGVTKTVELTAEERPVTRIAATKIAVIKIEEIRAGAPQVDRIEDQTIAVQMIAAP